MGAHLSPQLNEDVMLEFKTRAIQGLQEVRNLLSDPARWIKNSHSLDASGNKCGRGTYHLAVCWCSVGAIEHVVRKFHSGDRSLDYFLMRFLQSHLMRYTHGKHHSIVTFNDDDATRHEDVLQWLDSAIADLANI